MITNSIEIAPDYLHTLLIWLTGGDKLMSVDVPYDLGIAIESINLAHTPPLCYVEWIGEDKKHGIVWWYEAWLNKDKPKLKLSGIEIAKQITAAIEAGDIKKAMELQKML